jgi:FKBP-type peptidyl-prolyl cis-trans isomerase
MIKAFVFIFFLYSSGIDAVAQKPTKTRSSNTATKVNKPVFLRARGGLQYCIFPSSTKAPLIQNGQIVKFHYEIKIKDSIVYSSYERVPGFVKLQLTKRPSYNLTDILPKMKKGDSAITIQLVDTLMKQGLHTPAYARKGDKIRTTLCIIEVFSNDSLGHADYSKENEKDLPRQNKEQEEQNAMMQKAWKDRINAEDSQLEKSGEMAREYAEIESVLSSKKITTQIVGKGTYVHIKNPGTGPAVDSGKIITVEYTGRKLLTDSIFQKSTYTFQLGQGAVIRGWDEGLKVFKKGGSGTLYIPGFLAYGPKPPEGSPFKPFESLVFDIKIVDVKDNE